VKRSKIIIFKPLLATIEASSIFEAAGAVAKIGFMQRQGRL